jgi:hypothetical protein
MRTLLFDRPGRQLTFVFLMVSINLLAWLLVSRMAADPRRGLRVAVGASLDVTVVVSALYYCLLVRPGIRSRPSMAIVALAGLLHATYFFPPVGWMRTLVAGLCEAALIGLVVLHVRRGEALPFPPVVTKILETELTILYYALVSWRAKPIVPADARAFTIYKRVGQADLFAMLPLVSVLEIVPIHLLLNRWSPLAAWIATGLSIYGMIWLTGLARSFALRPSLFGAMEPQTRSAARPVTFDDGSVLRRSPLTAMEPAVCPGEVVLRYGLLFELRIPRECIVRIRPAEPGDKAYAVPRNSEPTICIEFDRMLQSQRLFGVRKNLKAVAFTPDNEQDFDRSDILPLRHT